MSGRMGRSSTARRRPEDAAAIRVQGNLDQVTPDGLVIGWCWSPDQPLSRRPVAVLVDGTEAVRATCGLDRSDLRKAGLGDGGYGFQIVIPPEHRLDGVTSSVTLRDITSGKSVGGVAEVTWEGTETAAPAAAPPPERVLLGNLDGVTKDGRVSGWCWYPDQPDHTVTLAILVDDVVIGTTPASSFRQDLHQAGIGTGAHGFSFALPWSVLSEKGQITISVQDHETAALLGQPMSLRLGRMAGAEDRMAELERQLRLLGSQVKELKAALDQAQDDRPSQAMFASLGQMFQHLSRGGAFETPGQQQHSSLRDAITTLQQRHPPFTLDIPDRPLATVAVPAQGSTAELYRCLAALRGAGVDRHAEIVLVDDASRPPYGTEAALLPSIVRNLRYLRLDEGSDLAACLNELARSAHTDMLVTIMPGLTPEPGWLEALAGTLTREADLALVGSRVVGRDGLLRHAGLLAQGESLPTPLSPLADANLPDVSFMRPVEAVGALAFGVRRTALLEAGGFQPGFATLGHATIDLCLRLRADGHGVVIQPAASVLCEDGFELSPFVPDLAIPTEDTRRLRQRWFETAQPTLRPVRFVGHALVIDNEIPRPDRDAGSVTAMEQMLLLRKLGYRVTFAAASGNPSAGVETRILESQGIEVVRQPSYGSVSDYLTHQGLGLDLVQVYRYMNAAMFLDRVRTLAPSAKLIFSPADLHHLRELRRTSVTGIAGADDSSQAIREQEIDCVRQADATILNSDFELGLLRDEVEPEKLKLLRWVSHPSPSPRGFAERSGLVFVGGFRHSPNVDGVCWFVSEVMPVLRARGRGLVLHIAGSDITDAVVALAAPDVMVHGWVADLGDLLSRVRLSVAPLRYGAGFKGKVATSLNHGVPVVGSGIALEGTGLAIGPGVSLAGTAQEFAEAILAVHDDADGWAERSAHAIESCRRLYSPEAALGVYEGILQDFGLPVLQR